MNAKAVKELLAKNPHPHRYTMGMFYREKIRALASVIPDGEYSNVLDVGGGRSSLCHLMFPDASIINCDPDPTLPEIWPWVQMPVKLVSGSATDLPFDDASFDCVTGFDVLEHVPEDTKAAGEMARVVKPGGYLFVSTPTLNFRHPYYSPFKKICYTEAEVLADWGHVRRGYTREQVADLFPGCELIGYRGYLNPLTVIAHDISFSRLKEKSKVALIAAQYPLTFLGYTLGAPGEEAQPGVRVQEGTVGDGSQGYRDRTAPPYPSYLRYGYLRIRQSARQEERRTDWGIALPRVEKHHSGRGSGACRRRDVRRDACKG